MIILDCDQNSEEWFEARLGIPTASNFDKIVTTKGEYSKQAQKYMYRLAAEKVTGCMQETYQNENMVRGIELEEEARSMFEIVTDHEIDQVGFCFQDDDRNVGCSPDGLGKGRTFGVEIKCPSPQVHVEYLLTGKLPTAYFQQVHGSMYVTGLEQWYFVSYYPGLKPLILLVDRDEKFCTALDEALYRFNKELEEIANKIKQGA